MSENNIKKQKGQKEVDVNIKDISDDIKITADTDKVSNTNPSSTNTTTTVHKRIKRDDELNQNLNDNQISDEEKQKAEDMFKDKKENNLTHPDDNNANNINNTQENDMSSNKDLKNNLKSNNSSSGLKSTSNQIDASSSLPKSGGTGSGRIPNMGGSKLDSNPLTQGLKKGAGNLGNAAKEGAKRAAEAAAKAVKEALKKVAAMAAKAIAANPMAWLVIAIVLVVLIVSILIYQLFNKDVAETDIDAKSESIESMQTAISNGEITGEINQVNEALELNTKYGSYLGFTIEQIDYLYKQATDTTDVSKESTRYSLINLYNKKFGLATENIDGLLSVSDYKELYKHLLCTEKYNFNEIEWLNYNHNQEGSRVLGSGDMTINTSMGIQYPKDNSMEAKDFMNLASPYLLSNYIPLSYLVSETTASQSDAFYTGIGSNQDVLDEIGVTSDSNDYKVENSMAYQILKYGLSDITISQYQIQHYIMDTYYLDYDATDYHQEFSVTENKEYTYIVYPNGSTSPTINTSTSYTYNNDLITITGQPVHNNTRWNDSKVEDVMKETVVSEYPTTDNLYYVTYAKSFDVINTANYNYIKYNDSDVTARQHANSESVIDSDYNETINGENKIDSVNAIDSLSELDEYGTYSSNGSTQGQATLVSDLNGIKTYKYIVSTNYSVTGDTYTINEGTRFDVNRQWDDEVTPADSNSSALNTKDLLEFNKNEEADEGKATIDENILKVHKDFSHYEDLATNKDLNVVDILDSNPKIYQNYISVGSAESEYIGRGRENIFVRSVYEDILNSYLDTIASENKLNLVYGSSLGYDVSSGSTTSANGSYGTAYSLMIQLLHEFEGGGTVYQNSEGVDCYKVLDVNGNMTVGYGIDITVNPQWKSQLESQMGSTISVGTLVPCELVDAIEEDFINKKLSSIESTCSSNGIDLKEYQKHALLIRMYNTGNISGFPNAYRSYFKPEVDDRYDQTYEIYKNEPENVSAITSCADKNSTLYKNYLSTPVTSNGITLQGLVKRRLEEYYLFSLGYYTHNDLHAFYTQGLSFNGIQVVKSDGSIDVDACYQLQAALEDSVFGGNFHSAAPAIGRPWGQRFKPNRNENTDDNSYLSDSYKSFFATSLYYQCPWWSRGRANIYLNSVDSTKFNGQFIRDGLGNGNGLAKGIANAYGVPFYTDLNQLTSNCVISYGAGAKYGHTAYVEAVGNDYYVISHCGSGVAWHGVSIVPKTEFGLGASYGVVGFVKMDDIVAKYK